MKYFPLMGRFYAIFNRTMEVFVLLTESLDFSSSSNSESLSSAVRDFLEVFCCSAVPSLCFIIFSRSNCMIRNRNWTY